MTAYRIFGLICTPIVLAAKVVGVAILSVFLAGYLAFRGLGYVVGMIWEAEREMWRYR